MVEQIMATLNVPKLKIPVVILGFVAVSGGFVSVSGSDGVFAIYYVRGGNGNLNYDVVSKFSIDNALR